MKYNIVVLMLLLFGVTGSAQKVYSLQECIRIGLERNYSIRIVRNEEMQSKNNVTLGNAGYLPTVDLEGGFSGDINNERNRLASDGSIEKGNGITSEVANVGLNVNWTIFDGFGIQANYERLKELHLLGALNTRIVIEDFIAELSSEYYNLIRQKIRLNNLRSTLELSRERVRIAETNNRRHPFRNGTTDAIFRTPATVVTGLNLLGHLFFAQGFQLFLGGVALISQALFEHHIDHFFVAVQTIHLIDRTFVVIEFQPLHAIDDHVNGFLRGALLVRVFNTKEELAAHKVACIGPAVNSRTGGAQVHHPGRRRCDTRANFFHFVLLETINRIC